MARITIKDIARESGYSLGTVSRALNHAPGVSAAAKEAIFKVVDKYSFETNPNAKFLKQKVREGIALVIRDPRNVFFADLAARIKKLLENKGYAANFYFAENEKNAVEEASRVVASRNPVGMVLLGADYHNLATSFPGIRIPCVLAGNSAYTLPFANLSSVCTADAAASQEAVEFLFASGHTRIGVIGGDLSTSSMSADRYHGVQYAFFTRGAAFDPALQYEAVEFTMEDGYDAFMRLLARMPDLSAVFCMSDPLAVGAMRAARDAGKRVPEDVSFIGFDGIELGRFTEPRLTTVCQDPDFIAQKSVEILLGMIEDPARHLEPERIEAPWSLAVRDSAKAAENFESVQSAV